MGKSIICFRSTSLRSPTRVSRTTTKGSSSSSCSSSTPPPTSTSTTTSGYFSLCKSNISSNCIRSCVLNVSLLLQVRAVQDCRRRDGEVRLRRLPDCLPLLCLPGEPAAQDQPDADTSSVPEEGAGSQTPRLCLQVILEQEQSRRYHRY